jgi:PAS domain S-box-containing protein
LTDYYGSERSFNRKAGDMVSAVSLRIPLAEAYAEANIFSLKLSAILLAVLACLFAIQYWLYRRYLLQPLNVMREKANEIATHEGHLGDQIPQPFGRELGELTTTFNEMSVKLRHDRDHLEELVDQRTEALRESEEIFSQFMNYSPIYVFFKDENIKSIRLSKNYTEMLGRPISELLGKNMDDLFPSDLAKRMVADDRRILKEGKKIEIEEELNGRFYSTIKFPIYREGKSAYLAGFTVDITERKRMEEEKRRMEERSHKLVDDVFRFIPEGVLVFSRKMELLRQNQAFRELVSGYARRLGFAEDELENLIIDKVKAGLRDNNIKEIKIARKHETGKQT